MRMLKGGRATIGEQVVPPSYDKDLSGKASRFYHRSKPVSRIQHARAQELLRAWDCDLWHLSRSPISPGLDPLTAEELEGLITRFPEVLPHIYVRPDAVLFETSTSKADLIEIRRRDLACRGEVKIHVYPRRGFQISQWCGGDEGAIDVLAFNTLRVKAIHQTLAPRSHTTIFR